MNHRIKTVHLLFAVLIFNVAFPQLSQNKYHLDADHKEFCKEKYGDSRFFNSPKPLSNTTIEKN